MPGSILGERNYFCYEHSFIVSQCGHGQLRRPRRVNNFCFVVAILTLLYYQFNIYPDVHKN